MTESAPMSEDPGVDSARTASGQGEPPVGQKRMSRRRFLQAAVAGGVAVGAASLGYWGGAQRIASPSGSIPAGTYTPLPSAPAGVRLFRSRPDLSAPLIGVTTPAFHTAPGCLFVTPAAGPGPVIVDDTGSPVWIHPTPGKKAFNLRVGTYRGAPVLTWFEGVLDGGTGLGEYVLMDRTYTEVTRVRAGDGLQGDLHEFITTPEGTALFSAYVQKPPSPVPSGTAQLLDSVVQEVDIATGRVLLDWRASDHVATGESYVGATAGKPYDFFHINSIDVDTDGNLLISARHTWCVYKLDRTSGAVIWRLGGKRSDFSVAPGAGFAWQHDARRQQDGSLTLFDDGANGSNPPTEDHSRGLVLDVTESTRSAKVIREYDHSGNLLARSQGSVQVQPNGNVLVGWGDQPYVTEFSHDGATIFDARLPDGSYSYRSLRYTWDGLPSEAPALATEPGYGDSTIVYVSWNGATGVDQWVVLAGAAADSLSPVGSRPRSGFETRIEVPGRPSLVAVRALNSDGSTLVESAPYRAL
jgi:hypothetical protein